MKFPSIETVYVFSDGPVQAEVSLFKSIPLGVRSWYLYQIERFATFHGKVVIDGIGGIVKRAVWRHILSERIHITTMQEYSALTKQLCPNIQVEFVAKSEIDQRSACQMKRGGGSIPDTQSSLYSSFRCGWGQSSRYFFNNIKKCFQVCRICNTNVTPSTTEQDSPTKTIPNLSYQHWKWQLDCGSLWSINMKSSQGRWPVWRTLTLK